MRQTLTLTHTDIETMRTLTMFMLLILLDGVTVRTAAQSRCDPQTQYEEAGQCCRKCGPGTRMSQRTCLDPQCVECEDHEYQDTHTTDTQCIRQQYCGRNKNQQVSGLESKKKRSSCICMTGFHCSGETCAFCLPHAICPPGEFAKSPGNHTHNTVCGKCPDGSFSNSSSWSGVCTKWTICGSEYYLKASGTHLSDNICEKSTRTHYTLIVALVGVCVLCLSVVAFLCGENAKQRTKKCWEACRTDPEKPPAEPMYTPVDDPDAMLPIKQEEGEARGPEENQEEAFRDTSLSGTFIGVSENGQMVLQERGKDEVQPQQETENTLSDQSVNVI